MTTNTHVCVCHGCGTIHTVEAMFMSSSFSIGMPIEDDGSMWTLPAFGCPSCMAITTIKQQDHPIAHAYSHGMSEEARTRMATDWPAWKPRVLALVRSR